MRCIPPSTSHPLCRCWQSQQIEALVYFDLTQCNEHYQWRHWSIPTGYNILLSHRLQDTHRQRRHLLPLDSLDSANCRPLIPRQTLHESLWCLCTQAIIVQQLIVVLGTNFRVSYTPAAHPDYHFITTLQDCISLLVIIQGFSLSKFPLMPPYQSFITIVSWRIFALPYN